MKMIEVCEFCSCGACPFYDSCGLDFPTVRPKDKWLELIQERIEDLEYLRKQIEAN